MTTENTPLTYAEILTKVREFEIRFNISSADLFAEIAKGQGQIVVEQDDLYEWQSYYEFQKLIEARLEAFLGEAQLLEALEFSEVGVPEAPTSCANESLALAA